jgi:hypothetical protein
MVTTEGVRLRASDPVPPTSPIFDGAAVKLEAARGETLGVVVYNRKHDTITIEGELPARLYAAQRAVAKRGSTSLYGGGRGPGAYPDMLREGTPTASDSYVEIDVPRSATAGAHGLTLHVGDKPIAVTVNVHDVTLPELAPRVWAYYDPRELAWAHLGNGTHAAPSPEEKACIAMFRRYGVMLSPDLPLAAWPARRELLAGFPFIPVKLDTEHVTDDVKGWIDATKGTGQLPFAIPIDEPRKPDAIAKVKALAQQVHDAGGGPSTFLYAVTADPSAELANLVDLFITLAPRPSARTRLHAGRTTARHREQALWCSMRLRPGRAAGDGSRGSRTFPSGTCGTRSTGTTATIAKVRRYQGARSTLAPMRRASTTARITETSTVCSRSPETRRRHVYRHCASPRSVEACRTAR